MFYSIPSSSLFLADVVLIPVFLWNCQFWFIYFLPRTQLIFFIINIHLDLIFWAWNVPASGLYFYLEDSTLWPTLWNCCGSFSKSDMTVSWSVPHSEWSVVSCWTLFSVGCHFMPVKLTSSSSDVSSLNRWVIVDVFSYSLYTSLHNRNAWTL